MDGQKMFEGVEWSEQGDESLERMNFFETLSLEQ